MSGINNNTMTIVLIASAVLVIGGLAIVPTTIPSAFAEGFGGGCGTGGGSFEFCDENTGTGGGGFGAVSVNKEPASAVAAVVVTFNAAVVKVGA